MRTIFTIKTTAKIDELRETLERGAWFPDLPQEHQIIEKMKDKLIKLVDKGRKDEVKETVKFVISHGFNNTWGIVNQKNKYTYTFRLHNESADELKHDINDLIVVLKKIKNKKTHAGGRINLSPIRMRNDKGIFAFFGTPNAYPIRHTLAESKKEMSVVAVALILGGLAAFFGSPIETYLKEAVDPDWHSFMKDSLGRITTTSFCTVVFLFAQLWSSIRKQISEGTVRWIRVFDEENDRVYGDE